MPFEEDDAYALATWKRLEDHISNDVLRAVCGAFAIISVADGDLDRRELDAFMRVTSREFSLDKVDSDLLERQFRDLADAVMTDPEDGRRRALDEVARVRGNKASVELVRTAARLAVGADERIVPVEVKTLDEICAALGIGR